MKGFFTLFPRVYLLLRIAERGWNRGPAGAGGSGSAAHILGLFYGVTGELLEEKGSLQSQF